MLACLRAVDFAKEAIEILGVDSSGVVDLDHLREILADGPPALVSVMSANNETGALQPVAEVADIVHEAGGLLHVDAVQALGKIPFDINQIKGRSSIHFCAQDRRPERRWGACHRRWLNGLEAAIRGGGQEQGRRAGTENVPGIAGFGAAVKAAMAALDGDMGRSKICVNGLRPACGKPRALVFSERYSASAQYYLVHRPRVEGRDRRDRF